MSRTSFRSEFLKKIGDVLAAKHTMIKRSIPGAHFAYEWRCEAARPEEEKFRRAFCIIS
jgi:hypothetical protein